MLRRVCTTLARRSQSTVAASSALSNNADIVPEMMKNRNPRNLERLRIGRKQSGYFMDKPGRFYWHKLLIKTTSRYVMAYIHHYTNGNIIAVSTNEWAIKKHLFTLTDTSAYINLGRVLADRCLMMGITEVRCDIKAADSMKLKLFLKELTDGGVSLAEPEVFRTPEPLDNVKCEKPWEVADP